MRYLICTLFFLLALAPPDSASASEYVVLSGVVGPSDSTCNAAVTPGVYPLAADSVLEVRLIVPTGATISGWSCNANLCSRLFRPEDLDENGIRVESMLIVQNDPQQTLGVTIVVADPELIEIPETIVVTTPPVGKCCSCPCDFTEVCY